MIEINLLPEELRKKESIKITLPDIPIKKTLILVFGVFFGLQLLFTMGTFYLRFDSQLTGKQIETLKESNREIERQKSETVGIHNRLKEARALTLRKFYWASLLNALSNSMTKGVWLRTFYVTEEEPKSGAVDKKPAVPDEKPAKGAVKDRYLVLEGSAVGPGQETAFIGKFLKQLKDNPMFNNLFQDVKPYNINQRRIKEYDVYDFMIYCKFRKDKS